MMSRHFRLSSELSGAIAKRLTHAKNQHYLPCSFFNQFVTNILYIKTQCFLGMPNFRDGIPSRELGILTRPVPEIRHLNPSHPGN